MGTGAEKSRYSVGAQPGSVPLRGNVKEGKTAHVDITLLGQEVSSKKPQLVSTADGGSKSSTNYGLTSVEELDSEGNSGDALICIH